MTLRYVLVLIGVAIILTALLAPAKYDKDVLALLAL